MIAELRRRGVYVTRVAYNPERWDPAPHRLATDSRIIHLAALHRLNELLLVLCLTGGYPNGRLELLLIPPDTAPPSAAEAMLGGVAGSRSPAEITRAASRAFQTPA